MVKHGGSRDRLLAAAAREFAAHGYAGASVDRIARAARLNKAMIYYHFKSKAGMHRAIVREVFEHLRAAAEVVAASSRSPEDKIRAFVRMIAEIASQRPHFPPLWLREFTAGARNVDLPTLRVAAGVVALLGRIIDEGKAAGRFRAVNPITVHIGIIAPILLFLVSANARVRLASAEVEGAAELTLDQIVAHVTESTLGSLRRTDGASRGK
jgi:TetR/AcrR family transcriptional regulator